MIQSVHCPSCDTRYGLRRARVRPGIRRAQCFRCHTIFGVETEIFLLLGEALPVPEAAAAPAPAPSPSDPTPKVLPEADLDLPSLEELQEAAARLDPGPGAEPVLSLEDLTGADEEILEKTLVTFPPPAAAEPAAEPAAAEAGEPGQGGYASAREAIAKLMGEAPPPAAYRPPSSRSGGAQMDVEATLDALETTLGGSSHATQAGAPEPEPPPALEPVPPALATVKLSRAEVTAAVSAHEAAAPPPAEPTLVLKVAPQPAPSPAATQPAMDPNLLKVQMGTDLYSNLTMEQLTGLAEQGRLMEYHMVARQFSDNWLEAGKVPGLRPVFERLRKMRLPDPPPSPLESAPAKKSLFGGLWGKGNG